MFITLLYVSAFMFFIAGRKIKHASLFGVVEILLASLPFSYRTLFEGYKIRTFLGQFISDIDRCDRNLLSFVFALFAGAFFALVFFLLAKGWSGDLFRDEIKSRKKAGRIFIAASVIPGIIALLLSSLKIMFPVWPEDAGYFFILFDNIGGDFLFLKAVQHITNQERYDLIRIANTVYVVLLFARCLICLILFNRKFFSFKDQPSRSKGPISAFTVVAETVALGCILTFLTLAQRGYIFWSANYRLGSFSVPFYYSYIYGSYNKREGYNSPVQFTFCMFVLAVLAVAALMLLISLIYMAAKKKISKDLFSFVFSVALLLMSAGCICKMIFEIRTFNYIDEATRADIYEKAGILMQTFVCLSSVF